MKILVIGDPHGKLPKGLTQIVKKNKIELIIVTGEVPPVPFERFYPKYLLKKLNNFYDSSYSDNMYAKLLSKLDFYGLPVIVLMGNAYVTDGKKFALKIFKKYKNIIHKKTARVKVKNKDFVLFDMIWERWSSKSHSREYTFTIESRGKKRIQRLEKYMKEAKNPVLVSHAPPYGILDKVPGVGHVGSKVLLRIIKKYNPKFVLCGHIHEGKGKKKIGKTIVINAGCRGDYYIINI